MLFTKNIAAFITAMVMSSALVVPVSALPTVSAYDSEYFTWLATTTATVNYVGPKPGSIAARSGGNVNVVYCTSRHQDVCGGTCTVYNGPATCITADTSCLRASADVAFCDHGNCHGSCNQFSTCGTTLNGGFCDTPGTKSITVPFI